MSAFDDKRHLLPQPVNYGQGRQEDTNRDIDKSLRQAAKYRERRDEVQDQTLASVAQLAQLQAEAEKRQIEYEVRRTEDTRRAKAREWWLILIALAALVATVVGVIIALD